jgi:Tfp pilus assembly protein PilV
MTNDSFQIKKILGASLIELLVSLVLMSILLLGVDAMQLSSLQQAQANYYFALAKQQISNISERLFMLDRLQAGNNPSNNNRNNNHPGDDNKFLLAWDQQNQEVLPLGKGIIKGRYPEVEISVFWGKSNGENCKTNKTGAAGCLHI